MFARDTDTGALSFMEVERDGVGDVDGLAGALCVTVSPDGRHVYVASNGANALAVFTRDTDTGALSFVEAERNGVGGVNGLTGASSVAVSAAAGGRQVYVASNGDNALAVFHVNE